MTVSSAFIPKQGTLSDLAGWIAGDLGAAVARLYSSNTVYTPDRVPSDYTEASFIGYSPISPLAWLTPFINSAGKAETDSQVLVWTFAGSSGTATAFGLYLTDPSQTKLLAVVPFITPVTLTPTDTTLSYVCQLTEVSEL